MFKDLFDLARDYLKDKAYWPFVQPIYTLLALYVVSLVTAYQYIEWRYHFTPELATFAHSYLVKQISVVLIAVALIILVLATDWRAKLRKETASKIGEWARSGARNLVVAATIAALAVGALLHFAPHRVSQIRVTFLETPVSFDKYAFAYLVYELNRLQGDWHFTLDLDTFNRDSRSSEENLRCGTDWLCYARLVAVDEPFIGIAETGFEQDSFWQNSGIVSVISAGQWKDYEPPSIYEYLGYSLIVQSTVIHLNRHCGGSPNNAFQESRFSYGDLFEFSPRRNEMKAAILTGHLSPKGQELLANCFGLEYMNACDRLLSLDWLRSGRIRENLERVFGTKL
jgi:multisubunit Na+/H+ antiporter MnhB subunit